MNSHLQLRVKLNATTKFGPGKADLLEHIAASGSISAAARAMRMSYKRAWQLVDAMNQAFRAPLVATSAGGSEGGGATLTRLGAQALKRYRNLQRLADNASSKELAALLRLTRRGPE